MTILLDNGPYCTVGLYHKVYLQKEKNNKERIGQRMVKSRNNEKRERVYSTISSVKQKEREEISKSGDEEK